MAQTLTRPRTGRSASLLSVIVSIAVLLASAGCNGHSELKSSEANDSNPQQPRELFVILDLSGSDAKERTKYVNLILPVLRSTYGQPISTRFAVFDSAVRDIGEPSLRCNGDAVRFLRRQYLSLPPCRELISLQLPDGSRKRRPAPR